MKSGGSLLGCIICGILGGIVGGFIGGVINLDLGSIGAGNIFGTILSIVGAGIIIVIARALKLIK
jgi:uncharacterized membrane protein YeaQ/YmgE (transglycosylase-associated protein family)